MTESPQEAALAVESPEAERRWRADVRLRALARRRPEPFRVPAWGWMTIVAAMCVITLLLAIRPLRRAAPDSTEIRIVLLDADAPEPPLPQPAPLPPRRSPVTPRLAAAPHTESAPESSAAPVPNAEAPHVFNTDGSIALPRETPPRNDAMAATFSGPILPESMAIMRHQRPLKVRPNHFAQNFRQPTGSTLTDFVADHLTAKKEFVLPWGTHVECTGVALFVAFVGGCGWYTPYRYYVPVERWKPASVLDEQ